MLVKFLRSVILGSVLIAGLVCGAATTAAAADKSALDLLPPTTVGYLEVARPTEVISSLLDHPLAKELLEQPAYEAVLARREVQQAKAALALVEEKLGMKWRAAVGSLAGGGLHVGFDLPTQGVVVLAQATDAGRARQGREAAISAIRAEAAARNRPDPVKDEELRGVAIQSIGDVYLAVLDKWLVATNKRLLLNMVLENHLDSGSSLGGDSQFQAVRKERSSSCCAWLYVDLRVLRLTGALRSLAKNKSNNPPLEVLIGGIVGVLPEANYVTASLAVDATRLKLTGTLPGDARVAAKAREFYFGPEASGLAPPLLQPPRTLLSLSSYRDFASLWRHAPDLFDDRINARMAEAESTLATFFGGRNFRDEILGNLQPGVQLVVARQEFPQAGVSPVIKLPAAALVGRMKNAAETARTFKISFQSIVGFANITGGMKGLPPLELNSEKVGEALVVSAEYLPPSKPETRHEAAIQHNFSPTIVLLGEHLILSSARPLALDLIEQVRRQPAPTQSINTKLTLDGAVGQAALVDNRGPLIAQNMLDRGHDRAAAEREINGLLRAATFLKAASIQLATSSRQLELDIELALAGRK